MTKYTITPWRTQSDLLQVRQQLYRLDSSTEDARRYAVDRVMAWKLRGNLPHAVESTALLIEAILHHNVEINSTFSIRAVYSAAFCRFVTGFCDIGRHKERSLEPSSMLDIARQIGMPVEFVALRHEATHEELPGLQRLVTATQQALEWLWNVYWSRLNEPADAKALEAARGAAKEEAASLLRSFRRTRRDALRSQTHNSAEQLTELDRVCDAVAAMSRDRILGVDGLAQVLVEQRLLVPSNRELESPLEGAYLIWDEMLTRLSLRLNDLFLELLSCLSTSISNSVIAAPENDVDLEADAMWTLRVLDLSTNASPLMRHVMKYCCLYSGYWTERIGEEVLKRGDGAFVEEWRDLFDASRLHAVTAGTVTGKESAASGPINEGEMEIVPGASDMIAGADDARGWVRAIVPPSTPIDVAA